MDVFKNWCLNFNFRDGEKLTLPKNQSICKIKCVDLENEDISDDNREFGDQPLANSQVFKCSASVVKKIEMLDGKEIICLEINSPEILRINYEPGDTIGILTENDDPDVNKILEQIGETKNADAAIRIENSDPKKNYLPSKTTLRILFKKFLNLRFIPLKQILLILAEGTSEMREKRMLEYLCSKEGADAYRSVILEPGTQFLDVISQFPSCRPKRNVLIQYLPRLLPRPYSITSTMSKPLRIVLSILPENQQGLCTGMIRNKLKDTSVIDLFIYFRKSHGFRVCVDSRAPLLLVGPGTGVAVFLGFLDHLHFLGIRRKVYIFTGFRYQNDHLFRDEFEKYSQNGDLTKIFISYSRENSKIKYVQENILENWSELGQLIVEEKALIYECGDFKKMANTVSDAFAQILLKYSKIDKTNAEDKIKEMKKEKRYLQDIWS